MNFHWQGRTIGNVGDLYSAIAGVTTVEQASEFWTAYRSYLASAPEVGEAAADDVGRSNVGYVIGYGSDEERSRLYALFGAVHPATGTPV